jgi:hypothetical protein
MGFYFFSGTGLDQLVWSVQGKSKTISKFVYISFGTLHILQIVP